MATQYTYEQLLQSIKAKKYAPVYYLYGEEHFFIDQISNYIEHNLLDEASKGFNQTIVYGKDAEVANIVSAARRFPMMSDYQVIIIKEAQLLKRLDDFETYLEKPVPSTILVICNKTSKLDKRTKFAKLILNHVVFESKKLYQDKIAGWIEGYLKAKNYTISPKAATLIADSLGNDLAKVVNELEKLIINKDGDTQITDTDVELKIGISREFNIFELVNALAMKNTSRVFHIAHHLSKSKDFSIFGSIINLNTFFNRTYIAKQSNLSDVNKIMSELKLNYPQAIDCVNSVRYYSIPEIERNIRLLGEYDLKGKGVNNPSTSHEQLFKELLLKML